MPQPSEKNRREPEKATERRCTRRLSLSFAIAVSGYDPNGNLFLEHTTTIDVSERGCRFDMQHELRPGAMVTIRRIGEPLAPHNGKRQLFGIVWAESLSRGWSVGAMQLEEPSRQGANLQDGSNIWQVAFSTKH